ncbi:DNA-binding protein [Ferrovibrio sp.]|uniref:DNA-binding protein n=1 Tax=Ferrovibrio sp. TaxID=1917215 RepID=UPI0035ADFF49
MYTAAELQEILLTENQLWRRWQLASAKKLQADRVRGVGCPYIKIGRLVRYRLSDVVAYEAKHRFPQEV